MIHQPLRNKAGGTLEGINYICNERIQNGTARVLRGNVELTKKIVKSITYKQKLLVGVLSFEESYICEDTKTIIMSSFEHTLLPGMEGRYNILWVEHTDKNRVELNYLIPKIDLLTQKSLTPYFDKFDRYRMEIWRDRQNILHKLSDPLDPSKGQTINNDKRVTLIEDYKSLNEILHNLLKSRSIHSRSQMSQMLNKNNIKTKCYKNMITVQLPKSRKKQKFKGGIYSEEFRDIRSLSEICYRRRGEINEYNNCNTREVLRKIRQKLNEARDRKAEYFKKKYDKYASKHYQKYQNELSEYRNRNERRNKKRTEVKFDANVNCDFSYDPVDTSNSLTSIKKKKDNVQNDSDKTNIERIRRKREAKRDSLREIREKRIVIYKQIRKNYKNIRREYSKSNKKSRERDFTNDPRIRETYSRICDYKWEGQAILAAIERITDAVTQIRTRNEGYKREIEFIQNRINDNKEDVQKQLNIDEIELDIYQNKSNLDEIEKLNEITKRYYL